MECSPAAKRDSVNFYLNVYRIYLRNKKKYVSSSVSSLLATGLQMRQFKCALRMDLLVGGLEVVLLLDTLAATVLGVPSVFERSTLLFELRDYLPREPMQLFVEVAHRQCGQRLVIQNVIAIAQRCKNEITTTTTCSRRKPGARLAVKPSCPHGIKNKMSNSLVHSLTTVKISELAKAQQYSIFWEHKHLPSTWCIIKLLINHL